MVTGNYTNSFTHFYTDVTFPEKGAKFLRAYVHIKGDIYNAN